MSMLTKWNADLFPSMKSIFDDFFLEGPESFGRLAKLGTSIPAANMQETEEGFHLDIATPGLTKEDIHVSLKQNVLTVSAEKKSETAEEDKEKNYSRKEFSFQSFQRVFHLPDNADGDGIQASYENGVLKLLIPKVKKSPEAEAAKKISIN